jgi:hypothetical protein
MIDMVSSLERVAPARRASLGDHLLERTWTAKDAQLWAAIGRVGARVPAYAGIDRVVPPAAAERWVDHLLRAKWDELGQTPLLVDAAVRLARVTGDRARDLAEPARKGVAKRLGAVGAGEAHVRAVLELVAVEEAERVAFWGESLPVGLRLA